MMEVKSSRFEMNAINIISLFFSIKLGMYCMLQFHCKFFIFCPKLKLALQY